MGLEAFTQLTHLTTLHTLRVCLSELEDDVMRHPQDISSLASLRSLRALTLETWAVFVPQDVASLQQLTELHLEGFDAAARLIKPARPMPNLRGATFTRSPMAQDMRFTEDSIFARWALRRAASRWPNVQVLHLGTLGSAPATVDTLEQLQQAAEVVDGQAAALLASAGPMDYFQLDTVMNIMDEDLDRRCEFAGWPQSLLFIGIGINNCFSLALVLTIIGGI